MTTLMSVAEYEYARMGQWETEGERIRPRFGAWCPTKIACPNCNRPLEGKATTAPYCWPPRAFLRCKPCGYERDSVA